MRDTSVISYHEISEAELGGNQRLVYDVIKQHPGLTDRELTRELGVSDPNKVRPRRFELVERGLVVEAGRRICSVSGKQALTWKIPDRTGDDPLFRIIGDTAIQTRGMPYPEWLRIQMVMNKRGYRYVGNMEWKKDERNHIRDHSRLRVN